MAGFLVDAFVGTVIIGAGWGATCDVGTSITRWYHGRFLNEYVGLQVLVLMHSSAASHNILPTTYDLPLLHLRVMIGLGR